MKTIRFFIFFSFLACIISCSQDEHPNVSDQLDIDNIEKRQVTIANWTPRSCGVLTIFIDPACGSNWSNSVGTAINAYNNVSNTTISLEEVSNEPADIVINCVEFNEIYNHIIGWAEIPYGDGVIGDDIFLNTTYEDHCNDPCWFQSVTMHEIAHTLGILHNESALCTPAGPVGNMEYDPVTKGFTFESPNSMITPEQITGTQTGHEDGSIFNSILDNCDNSNCTFTADDILALQTLYPDDDPCNCPQFVDDMCDCPESVDNICDCPDAVTDPCDCPDIFPDEIEFTCYCICYVLSPLEETTNFELHYVENSRNEIDCDKAASASCTEFNDKSSYCEIVRECAKKPVVEEEEKCVCKCTISSSLGQEEPLSWEEEVDCDKPEECSNAHPGAECVFIRK